MSIWAKMTGFAAVLALAAACATPMPSALPQGFVRLSDIDRTIVQDMRYATSENFLGRPAVGYPQRAECVLTRPAAEALKRVQDRLRASGETLVVFDCFRPVRTVEDFVAWASTPGPDDPAYRPGVPKDRLIPDGYIGARSAHSRGSTVDLAIGPSRPPAVAPSRTSACGTRADRLSHDFGTPFDCFHPSSALASDAVGTEARANRQRLADLMLEAGFRGYSAEWWHFTLRAEPFPEQRFDAQLPARRSGT